MKKKSIVILSVLLSLSSFSVMSGETIKTIKTQSEEKYDFVNPYRPGQGLKKVKSGQFDNIIYAENNMYAYNTLSCSSPSNNTSFNGEIIEPIKHSGFYGIAYNKISRAGEDKYCSGVYKIIDKG